MIFDTRENAARYAGMHPGILKAINVLADYADKAPGRYEIDGDALYIMVQAYDTRLLSVESLWETHEKYADVQYVVSGKERMGIADAAALTVVSPYEAARDAALYAYKGEAAHLLCPEGSFAVFFPGEAHMPGIADGDSAPVRKLVAKVQMG